MSVGTLPYTFWSEPNAADSTRLITVGRAARHAVVNLLFSSCFSKTKQQFLCFQLRISEGSTVKFSVPLCFSTTM